MIATLEALERLKEGNLRYVSEAPTHGICTGDLRRREFEQGQHPFAVVLGCSDSRVPAELIFDQGPGDLFVIRVAGNIAAHSQMGSVEYAARRLGTRLVVVLGHSWCGAVQAAFEAIAQSSEPPSPSIQHLLRWIRPAVEPIVAASSGEPREVLVPRAVRANIVSAASRLRNESDVLREHIERDGLLVVGAEYSLETGLVDFFDGVPG